MKLFSFFATCVVILFTGCIKDEKGCTNAKPADEEAQILAYASANGITATKHSSGMYYQIINPGSGTPPTVNSTVKVTYVGKFLSNQMFDQSTSPISFPLRDVIEGWIVGIPLISKGGKIKMIVPSSLAYGCNGARTIPPNSVLFFDVDLVDIQ